jgi:hypothetical protein
MFLKLGGATYTTEYALCGINHSGNQTNWFRGPSTANTPNDGVGGTWSYDDQKDLLRSKRSFDLLARPPPKAAASVFALGRSEAPGAC